MCEAFEVAELALMIRGTRGRSRRPNHMHSHLDALQTLSPVNFRRGARGLHSVAEQASFDIASGKDFEGFRKDFGRFSEAKMEAKIDFWEVFFEVVFECVFASILGSFLEARNLKNSNFASTGARFS